MRTVFHLSSGEPGAWEQGLGNIANLLDDDSIDLQGVAAVVNGGGIDRLVTGSAYADEIGSLLARDVDFRACRNSLESADVGRDELLDGVELVSSAMGELTRLQSRGDAYVKP